MSSGEGCTFQFRSCSSRAAGSTSAESTLAAARSSCGAVGSGELLGLLAWPSTAGWDGAVARSFVAMGR